MKRLTKEELKKFIKNAKKIKLEQTLKKSYIFFPIEMERTEEVDGFSLTIKPNLVAGSKMEHTPGIILVPTQEECADVNLAYANLNYSPDFDLVQYMELVDCTCSKDFKEMISELDCKLVASEYISISFEIK